MLHECPRADYDPTDAHSAPWCCSTKCLDICCDTWISPHPPCLFNMLPAPRRAPSQPSPLPKFDDIHEDDDDDDEGWQGE